MDGARSIDECSEEAEGFPREDEPLMERPPAIGGDERRMHVRAYNHWVSLLAGRAYPSVDDLDPEHDADFGEHAVLLDFSRDAGNPGIIFLGGRLRGECALEDQPATIAEVPPRSLLARLTEQYQQIIVNRAPIGFEAEFVGQRGNEMLYRGILMPFSSDDRTIDFIYGVVNWKELADAGLASGLAAEIARAAPSAILPASPVWADGPSGAPLAEPPGDARLLAQAEERVRAAAAPFQPRTPRTALADHLDAARELAGTALALEASSRAALHRAVSLAYDLAIAAKANPEHHLRLLADAHLRPSPRAPMMAIARLVFGAGHPKTQLTTICAALTHAHEAGVPAGALGALLEATPGSIGGLSVRHPRTAA